MAKQQNMIMNEPSVPDVQLHAALLAHPDVEDCAVLVRESEEGSIRVAYVVLRNKVPAAELAAEAPGAQLYLPVAALPLTPAGELDRASLAALPVIDEALAAQAEALATPARVAFLAEAGLTPLPPLHLSDVLPEWTPETTPAVEPAGRAPTSDAPASAGTPSLRSGPPLATPVLRNLPAALARTVASHGTGRLLYLQEDGTEIVQTYAELAADAERILASLRAHGALPGDPFLFQFRRNQDFIPAFWACQLGGFIPVPISIAPTYEQPNATVAKLQNAWEMLGRPAILTDRALAPAVRGVEARFDLPGLRVLEIETLRQGVRDTNWHDAAPGDLGILLLTSGSTGKPKAVRQTQHALLSRSAATAQGTGLSSDEVLFNWMPLDHVGGIVMFHLLGVVLGCTQIHIPTASVLERPLLWLDLIDRYRVTNTWAPNFAFGLVNRLSEELAQGRWDLSTLRFILNAGESIVARTARHFLELLLPHGLPATAMRPAWGMSETCSAVMYSERFTLDRTADADLFVQVGEPAPEFAMRIVDAADAVVEEGVIGRIQVRGPSVTQGYDQNPAANAESFTNDGWFITGDLGRIDDGQMSITGRQKEVIIVNGVNFYPHELEAVVEEVPGVAASFTAVCAIREPGTDTDGIAVFFHSTMNNDTQLPGILREIRGRLVRNAGVNPTYLVPVEKRQVPKTEIGKIQRTQMQQRLLAGDFKAELKRVEILTESASTLPDWFLERVWQPRQAAAPASPAPRRWLVFSDRGGLGKALAARLPGEVVEMAPGDTIAEALARLPNVTDVLHLRTCDAGTEPAEAGLLELIALAHALAATARPAPIRLTVFSRGAQFVNLPDVAPATRDGASPDPHTNQAAIPAALRSLAAEEPGLHCLHLDLDSTTQAEALLADCLATASPDAEVAWRSGVRYVPRLRRFASTPAMAGDSIVPGGLYLLTGGLGGIGVEMARILLTRYGAHVLLAGRSAAAGPALATLKALGPVLYQSLDVADAPALEAAVVKAERTWHRPLAGILHMAALYHDGPLIRENAASLAEIFHAKAGGALAVASLLDHRPDALFIGFSSVLGLFPGALVGAYAGANRVVDFVAQSLRARGRRATSVAWSSWRETGMSRGQSAREALRAKGIREVSIEQGWLSLLVGLRHGLGAFAVGLDPANPAIRRTMTGEPCGLTRLEGFYLDGDDHARAALAGLPLKDRFGTSVPFTAIAMPELPMTATGEIDRVALAASIRRGGAAPYAEPATETERQICALWQDALNAPHLGAEDNFFMFGGHSLLATRVMARLQSMFHVELPLRSLFDNPTVRALAARVDLLQGTGEDAHATLLPLAQRDTLPLSFTQQRLWFLDQWQPGGRVYNVPLVFRLEAPLDTAALQQSLNAIVARHEALRTTFHAGPETPFGRAADSVAVPLEVAESAGEAAAYEHIRKAMNAPFDLAADVLLRAVAVRTGPSAWLLALALHHIAADGWSLDLLFRELTEAYAAYTGGHAPAWEPLPVQFADYAAWQHRYLAGPVMDEQLAYWRAQLAGAAPQLRLRTDKPRPATESFRGAVLVFAYPRELAQAVAELCRAEAVTPYVALLSVLQVLLRVYSGQNDISIGSPMANRTRLETEGLIGFFANTLVLRGVLAGDPTFRDVLARSRETVHGAYAHQHMPFERLVETLKPVRAGYNPLFQVNFRVLTAAPEPLRLGDAVAERLPFDPGTSRFDLALELLHTGERLEGFFEYSTDLFVPETIARIRDEFAELLALLCRRPDAALSTLPLDRFQAARLESGPVIRRRPARQA